MYLSNLNLQTKKNLTTLFNSSGFAPSLQGLCPKKEKNEMSIGIITSSITYTAKKVENKSQILANEDFAKYIYKKL